MSFLKKSMSVALAVIMAVSCLAFSTTAYAADPAACTTLNFDGVDNNSAILSVMNSVNAKRQSYGLGALTADYALTQYAKQRAKEAVIHYDNDILPNGDSAATYIPGYGTTCAAQMRYLYNGFDDTSLGNTVPYYLTSTSYAWQSVGVGVFTYDKYTVVCYLLSTMPTATAYQDYVDTAVTASVSTLKSNISNTTIGLDYVDNKLCYDMSVKVGILKGVTSTMTLKNSDFNIKSSNSSVMKVKGNRAYIKNTGKFIITATSKVDPSFAISRTESNTGVNKPKVTLNSVKSSKKKTMTVKWRANVIDATGYEVQYSTSKKFTKKTTKSVFVKGKNTSKKTISKLKKGKKYYVKVRAYVDQGSSEKYYASFSKTKTVKVK